MYIFIYEIKPLKYFEYLFIHHIKVYSNQFALSLTSLLIDETFSIKKIKNFLREAENLSRILQFAIRAVQKSIFA